MSVAKRVLVAGATGVIGRRLVPILVAAGHVVTGLTRSPERAAGLQAMGAWPVVVDVFDREGLRIALSTAEPDVVIHQLTDLATAPGQPIGDVQLARTAEIRDIGTANLIAAVERAGVGRLIAQSLAGLYAPGPQPHSEADPLLPLGPEGSTSVRGVRALERRVGAGTSFDGIVLRYGWLYGPGTGADAAWQPPGVHVDAAAAAAVLAVDRGGAGTYNIVDDDGPVSSQKARLDLGWDPSLRLLDPVAAASSPALSRPGARAAETA